VKSGVYPKNERLMNPEFAVIATVWLRRSRRRQQSPTSNTSPQCDHILKGSVCDAAQPFCTISDITNDKHEIQTNQREVAMKQRMDRARFRNVAVQHFGPKRFLLGKKTGRKPTGLLIC
jgi:hypothetical protein